MTNPHPENLKNLAARCAEELPILQSRGVLRGARFHPLAVGTNTLGRLADNDIVVPWSLVSRRHCAIVVDRRGRCEIHDRGSTHGVYVNGRRITGPTALGHGDEVSLGGRQFVLLCPAA